MGGCQSSTIDETSPLHSMHPNHQWLRDLLQQGVYKIEFVEDGVKIDRRNTNEPKQNTCPNFKDLKPIPFEFLGVPIGFYNPKTGMFDKPEGNMNVCKTLTVLGKGGFGKVEAIKCGGNFFARKTMFNPKYLDHERSGSDYMYGAFEEYPNLSSALDPDIRESLDDVKTNTHVRLVKGKILHPIVQPYTTNPGRYFRAFTTTDMKEWWVKKINNGDFTNFCQQVINVLDKSANNNAEMDALKYRPNSNNKDTSRYFTDFKPENIMWSEESNSFVLIDTGSVSRGVGRCYTAWFTGNLIGVDGSIYMTNRDVMIMSMAMTFSYIGQYTAQQDLQTSKDKGINLIKTNTSSPIKESMIGRVVMLVALDKYPPARIGGGEIAHDPYQTVFDDGVEIGPYPSIPYEFDTVDIGEAMRGTIEGQTRHRQLDSLLPDEPGKLPGKLPEDFEPLKYDRLPVLGAPNQYGGGYRATAIASGLAVTAAAAFAPR